MYNYKEWQNDKNERNLRSSYVWTRQQLMDIDPEKTDYALGMCISFIYLFIVFQKKIPFGIKYTLYGKIRFK